jgi:hypothetical protein
VFRKPLRLGIKQAGVDALKRESAGIPAFHDDAEGRLSGRHAAQQFAIGLALIAGRRFAPLQGFTSGIDQAECGHWRPENTFGSWRR